MKDARDIYWQASLLILISDLTNPGRESAAKIEGGVTSFQTRPIDAAIMG
jgi:hypothetical protein